MEEAQADLAAAIVRQAKLDELKAEAKAKLIEFERKHFKHDDPAAVFIWPPATGGHNAITQRSRRVHNTVTP